MDYSRPIGDGVAMFLYSNWSYRTKVNFFLYESREFTGRPLLDVAARAGIRWHDGKYEAAIYCRNCFNNIVNVGGIDYDNLAGYVNDPRIIGVSLTAHF